VGKNHSGGETLSGGEQQTLTLGRAIMSALEVILLDEPSLGLAPKLLKEVFDIIGTINRDGKTVLLLEQNAFAALNISDYA
jgi:branched-chain amino acid transport system ATP-binding protein